MKQKQECFFLQEYKYKYTCPLQALLRSSIRISDGRAKPIDLLAKYISNDEDGVDAVEMHEPYTYLNGLTTTDLEDLLEDIKVGFGVMCIVA